MKKLFARAWVFGFNKAHLVFPFTFFAAALCYTPGSYWWESWGVKWYFLVLFLCFWLGVEIWKRIHWSAGIAFIYTVWSSARIFATDGGDYSSETLFDLVTYKSGALYTCLTFVLISLFYLIMRHRLADIRWAFVHFCWLDQIFTIFGWIKCAIYREAYLFNFWEHPKLWVAALKFNRLDLGGAFGNPSMNICFLVFSLPLLLQHLRPLTPFEWAPKRWLPFYAAAGGVVTIVLMSTTLMPLVTAAVTFGAFHLAKEGFTKRLAKPFWVIAFLVAIAFPVHYGHKTAFDTHGRARVWKMAMEWWDRHDMEIEAKYGGGKAPPQVEHLWGTGNGTAQMLLSHIQMLHGDNGENHGFFFWLHSDFPLQVKFELGNAGLVIYSLVIIFVLLFAWRDPYLFASCVGTLTAAMGNYPSHMAFAALFLGYLVTAAFTIRKSRDECLPLPE